jgi:hypothetical protein
MGIVDLLELTRNRSQKLMQLIGRGAGSNIGQGGAASRKRALTLEP